MITNHILIVLPKGIEPSSPYGYQVESLTTRPISYSAASVLGMGFEPMFFGRKPNVLDLPRRTEHSYILTAR